MFNSAEAITPHDSNAQGSLAGGCQALWVGGAGNLTVNMKNGAVVTFTGVPAGTQLDINVTRVRATLTTATSIVALY